MFDTGNTAFMLAATGLVMFMTPGLAFFYGGLVGRKNTLAIMMQSFVSLGWVTVLWFVAGYSLCFSGDVHGVIGNLDQAFLKGIDIGTAYAGASRIPLLVFVSYQLMFAVITPALITGAFANRIRFTPYMIFITLWLFLVYFPLVHMVWGNGLLAKWGVLDFAGGIVVHASAGMAALASVFFVGKRKVHDPGLHSIPLVALGTGMLWFGWFGFNAGSELQVNGTTAQAFLNTQVGGAFAGMTWLLVAWLRDGKPKLVAFLTGAVAGLATVTPCAGYVTVGSSALVGIAAGLACYAACDLRTRLKWDDALDVWGVHGVGGITGTILLGVFATKAVNPDGADGLLLGNGTFFGKQVAAVAGVGAYAFVISYGMLWLIDRFVAVRTTEAHEHEGLDGALHGEQAYDDKGPHGAPAPAVEIKA
jgi:Amt family ammonium transporter